MPKDNSLLVCASGQKISASKPSQSFVSVNKFQFHIGVRKIELLSAEDAGRWPRPARRWDAQIVSDPFR